MAADKPELTEEDQAAVERFGQLVVKLEEALYWTMVSACSRALSGGSVEPRRKSRKAWRALLDDVVEFAMEDD